MDTAIAPLIDSLLAMAPTLPATCVTEADSLLPDGATYNLQSMMMGIVVPEPTSLAILSMAGLAIGVLRTRRKPLLG